MSRMMSINGPVLLNSILFDIRRSFPEASEEQIVEIFEDGISEVLPQAIHNIQVARALSPFEQKRRQFLYLRSNKAVKERMEETEEDIEVIIRASKAIFESPRMPSSIPTSEHHASSDVSRHGTYAYWEEMQPTGSSQDRTNHSRFAFPYEGIGSTASLGLTSTGSTKYGRGIGFGTTRMLTYEIDDELIALRDISMAKGRFLSVLEREARKYATTLGKRLFYKLTSERGEEYSVKRLILKFRPDDSMSLDETNNTRVTLLNRIRTRLRTIAEALAEPEKSEFSQLIDLFIVEPSPGLIPQEQMLQESYSTSREGTARSRHGKNSARWLLQHVKEKIKDSKNSLSIDDIDLLARNLDEFREVNTRQQILASLKSDMNKRRERDGIDPIEELYRGENHLPPQRRLGRVANEDLAGLIKEALQALLLSEYRRAHREWTSQFIQGTLAYEEFKRRRVDYMKKLDESWPS